MIGFFAYCACAMVFYALAANARMSKLPVGFWAHEKERPKVKDIKGYNHAVAKMFTFYGTVLVFTGLPMLLEMSEVWLILISILGVVFGTLILLVCAVRIDGKYRSKE